MRRLSKIIAAAAAMVLILAMSTSVFAANSPVVTPGVGTDESGNTIIIERADITDGYAKEKIGATVEEATENLPAVLEDDFGFDLTGLTVEVLDVTAFDGEYADYDGGLFTVTFTIKGAKGGDLVYVLQYSEGAQYLTSAIVGEDGVIEVELPGFDSTYFFAVKDAAGNIVALPEAEAPGALAVPAAPDKPTSPKTGF